MFYESGILQISEEYSKLQIPYIIMLFYCQLTPYFDFSEDGLLLQVKKFSEIYFIVFNLSSRNWLFCESDSLEYIPVMPNAAILHSQTSKAPHKL